jgi:hypothetical protein
VGIWEEEVGGAVMENDRITRGRQRPELAAHTVEGKREGEIGKGREGEVRGRR